MEIRDNNVLFKNNVNVIKIFQNVERQLDDDMENAEQALPVDEDVDGNFNAREFLAVKMEGRW